MLVEKIPERKLKATLAAIASVLLYNPAFAQSFDDPEPHPAPAPATVQVEPELADLQVLSDDALAKRITAQAAAQRIANEAMAYIQNNKKSLASKRIRAAVRKAMSWPEDPYSDFIAELNEQLERKNVFQHLGLHQRPHAAATPEQYKAELGLYGQRTLLASVLATIGPEAIRQGTLGDCWFLSTLAVVADDYPYLIPSMITVNPDASYTVKFPGNPHSIHVKALADNSTRPVGAHSTEFGDWPFVLECAATALYPEQMRRGGPPNVALKLLTGVDSSEYSLTSNSYNPVLAGSNLSETLVAALETYQPVMVISHLDGAMARNHAFSIIDVVPANEEHSAMVTVRNPWGWPGFRADVSEMPDIDVGSDGRFTLPITSLPKYFRDVVVPNSSLRIHSNVTSNSRAPQPVNSELPALQRRYFNNGNGGGALPKVPRSYIRGR